MFMGRLNGINRYKHGIMRTSLYVDNDSNSYLPGRKGSFIRADWDTELRKFEACLTNLGYTLTTPYDEEFIAQKQARFAPTRDFSTNDYHRSAGDEHSLNL